MFQVSPSILPTDEDTHAAVCRYDVLDTPPDGTLDRVTAMTARRFDVPIRSSPSSTMTASGSNLIMAFRGRVDLSLLPGEGLEGPVRLRGPEAFKESTEHPHCGLSVGG